MEYEINSGVFSIVTKSLKITWDNFGRLFKLLFYPVFGQFLGIIICFVPMLIAKFIGLDFAPLLLVTLFGLAIGITVFCHAFWKYLLCQGVIVQMSKKVLGGNSYGSLESELDAFSRRSKDYIKYLLLMCLIGIIIAIPACLLGYIIFGLAGGQSSFSDLMYTIGQNAAPNPQLLGAMLIGIVVFTLTLALIGILFTVSLQTFVLNPMLIPMDAIKKSVSLVKKNYFKTIGAMIVAILFMLIISLLLEGCLGFLLIAAPAPVAKFINELASNLFANFFTTPFYLIFLTWWYLRISSAEKS